MQKMILGVALITGLIGGLQSDTNQFHTATNPALRFAAASPTHTLDKNVIDVDASGRRTGNTNAQFDVNGNPMGVAHRPRTSRSALAS